MVARWPEQEDQCSLGNAAQVMLGLQGGCPSIDVKTCELAEPVHVYDQCSDTIAGTRNLGSIEKHVRKKHKGGPSSSEVRLVKRYLGSALPLEEEIDDEALCVLTNSSTFRNFVHRSELEDEVLVLHQQLQQEVELHTQLERALANTSDAAVPNTVLRDLPVTAQTLLAEIAMLEAAIMKLEKQSTALQWELVHEQTEREVIEQCLNHPIDASLKPSIAKLMIPSSSNPLHASTDPKSANEESPPKSSAPSLTPNSPVSTPSPTPVTLKELLRTPCPAIRDTDSQLCNSTPIKSARRSLWYLWSGQDRRASSAISLHSTPEDQASPPPSSQRTCFPSPSPGKLHPSFLFSTFTASPFATPADHPRHSSPATPAPPPKQQHAGRSGLAPPELRKDLFALKLLPSAKRLAFWNFSSSDDDASSQSTESSTISSFEFVQQQTSSSPSHLQAEKQSLDEDDFTKTQDIRSCEGASPSSSLSAPSSANTPSPTTSDDCSAGQPQQCPSRSPRQCKMDVETGFTWTDPPKDPNRLSEEMARCMMYIYCHLADSRGEPITSPECPRSLTSHTRQISSSFFSSLSESSCVYQAAWSPMVDSHKHGVVMGCEMSPDPYKAMGKLPWADIGPYKEAMEVPCLSIRKDQLEYVAHILSKFRLLVERLAKVDPSGMTHDQKLAFWINLYNALLMHTFLAYGIPRNDLKSFTLMQKAAYRVGGHWFNAAVIEHCVLKGKVIAHRPQFAFSMALNKNKLTEEQCKYGIDRVESRVNFALSCGTRSSPMVRIYTPECVQEELDSAFHDYVRASVGMTSKGRLLVPKLVYNYARDFVDDASLLDWVCQLLPTAQVAVLYERIQQRRGRLLNSTNFTIAPFNFTYRYLLPRVCSKNWALPYT